MRSVNKGLERRRPRRTAILLLLALGGSTGCGNLLYAAKVSEASSKLDQARALGAERYAPYEYYYAREHLEQAERDAAEASYGDAIELAEVSREHASKAIQLTRAAHSESSK